MDLFQGGRTDSGIRVSELTAFQTTTFLCCVDLIAGKIGALPRHVFERTLGKSGRAIHRLAYDHDYYDLINLEPNDEMSGNTFLKAFMCHCLAWGNGYAELQRDEGNNVIGIWPRNPAKTRPKRLLQPLHLEAVAWRPFPVNLPAGTMVYQTSDGVDDQDHSDIDSKSHPLRFIPSADMMHVPGIAFDGRVGQSVVWLARQTIGLALATEKFGAKYFSNFARPGGLLISPANQTAEAQNQSKNSWQEAQGGENSNRIAVMPPGWDWKPMTNNPEEAQTIETRKFSRNEICSIFHVPPHMAGETGGGRANTEQLAQELKEYCLDPWLSALKIEFKRKFFPHRGVGRTPRSPFFVDFDLSDMLRPDAASREKFYASGRMWGFLNADDVRSMEKLNPIEESDIGEAYWMPGNMTLATTPMNPTHQDGAGVGAIPDMAPVQQKEKVLASDNQTLSMAYGRLFQDSLVRLLKVKNRDSRTFRSYFSPILLAIRDLVRLDAERELRCEIEETEESDKFIVDYIGGMQKRSAEWTEESADAISPQELDRAVRAIRISAFREVATARAKETT